MCYIINTRECIYNFTTYWFYVGIIIKDNRVKVYESGCYFSVIRDVIYQHSVLTYTGLHICKEKLHITLKNNFTSMNDEIYKAYPTQPSLVITDQTGF